MNNGKSKFLAVLLFVVSILSLSLFGISCKDKKDSGNGGITKESVYAYKTEEENFFVTLDENNAYVLTFNGEKKKGSYTLSESGELKLGMDGNDVTATVKGDELVIVYGEKTYTLLEQIDRKVTFYDDGAATVKTVLNGNAADKPNSPQDKGDKKFVGWYTSADFTEVYNFATPVRGDIAVYARYILLDAGANEFVATLKDGSDKKIETSNGVVYGLEPLADKDGKAFDGWYVSYFNDENKLGYVYTENVVLTEDVNLYPVWKGDIYAVSVANDKITWKTDDSVTQFEVRITDSENVAETKKTTQATAEYKFSDVKAGEYKIEISKNNSDEKTVVYYNNKALPRVAGINYVDGGVISYNPVVGAEKYVITVDCGNKEHKHTEVDNGKYTYFDISGCEMQKGGIKVTLKAQADGYATSSTQFVVDRTLGEITAEIKDDKLIWKTVANAVNYVITVNGDEFVVNGTNEFSLAEYARGEYDVKIYPATKGYNSPAAAEIKYNKTTLATPAGITVNGNSVKWNAVDGAVGYQLDLNGKIIESETAKLTLSDEYFVDGIVSLKIRAIGASDAENSAYTAVTEINYNNIDGITYADGKVCWNPVYSAAGYAVTLNGLTVAEVDAGITSAAITFNKSGENVIGVKYIFDDGTAAQAKTIKVNSYGVKFVGLDGNSTEIFVAKGDEIAYPELTLAGYELNGWYNVPSGGKNNGLRVTDKTLDKASDIVLYAYYVAKSYEITLDYGDKTETTTVRFSEEFTLPVATTSDENLTFGGWYSDLNGMGISYTDADGVGKSKWSTAYSVTLYASWIKIFEYKLDNSGDGYIVVEGPGLPYVTTATVSAKYNGKNITSLDSLAKANRLKTIMIPDTADIALGAGLGLSTSVFSTCPLLESIEVYKTGNVDEPKYVSDGGVLYSVSYANDESGNRVISEKMLVLVPAAKSGILNITDSATKIGTSALAGSLLEKVTVPSSVNYVGDNAFAGCLRLTEIEFLADSSSDVELTLGDNVFDGCTALKTLTLPGRIQETSCTVEDSYGYTWSMDFDKGLLEDSGLLETINIVGKEVNYSSYDGMITSVDGSTIIYCPKGRTKDIELPLTVTEIGNGAFEDCRLISRVKIPGSVVYIGNDAFRSCYAVADFKFEGNSDDAPLTIKTGGLYYSGKYESLVLPENLVTLERSSIYSSDLKTVTVNSVGRLNGDKYELNFSDAAFGYMSNSAYFRIENLHIGANVPEIAIASVFGSELKIIDIDPANTNYATMGDITGVLYSADGTRILYYPAVGKSDFTVPDGVREIGANIFRGNSTLTKIHIPESVEKIGVSAFYGCGILREIDFVDGKTNLEIGDYAFSTCSSLTKVVLPARLTKLGNHAFEYNSALAEVKFAGTKVRTIGNYAFTYCKKLVDIVIPEGVETIGECAFSRSTALASVTMPSTLAEIGKDAFEDCESLSDLIVAESNNVYTTLQGILYKNSQVNNEFVPTELIFCPISCGGLNGIVNIPETVESVVDSAFANNKLIEQIIFTDLKDGREITLGEKLFRNTTNLKVVKLPEGLKTIGRNIFWNAGVEEVTIPGSVTLIDAESFYCAVNLRKLNFADGTEPLVIADGADNWGNVLPLNAPFYACSKLEEVILPERTTEIGACAFYTNSFYGTSIKKVYIPSNVERIGAKAFYGCVELQELTFGENSKLTEFGEYAFYNARKLKNVVLPSELISTGYCSFANSGLTSVEIPSTVTLIGGSYYDESEYMDIVSGYTFYQCTNLQKVVLNGSASLEIQEFSFAGCSKLSEIQGTAEISEIGESAFYKTALTAFEVPASVRKIGKNAFKFTNLNTFRFLTDQSGFSSVAEIGDGAFVGTKLTEFALPETAQSVELGAELFKGNRYLTKLMLPSSQTAIGDALVGCVTVEEIEVDENNANMSVEDGVLYNRDHSSIYYVFKGFDGVLTLSPSMRIVADGSYMGQVNITKVIIPSTVEEIRKNAFKNCTSLKEVEFVGGAPSITEIADGAFENCSALETITLPVYAEKIGDRAFKGCISLKQIVIGEKVETIGESAFEETALTEVALPQTLKEIGAYAFADTDITSVTIPASVEKMGTDKSQDVINEWYGYIRTDEWCDGYVFYGCDNLKKVVFADGSRLAEVGDGIFKDCVSLVDVKLNFAVLEEIGEAMFSGCTSLEEIVIPEGIVNIKAYAFKGCTKLSSVKLPSTLRRMCSPYKCTSDWDDSTTYSANLGYQFADCTSLKTIEIPEGVTYIGSFAFTNSGLTRITLPSTLKFLTARNESLDESVYSFHTGTSLSGLTSSYGEDEFVYQSAQFAHCANLEEVILPIKLQSIGARVFWDTPKLRLVTYDGAASGINTFPESLKFIGGYVFSESALTEFTLPSSVNFYSYVFSESNLESVDLSASAMTVLQEGLFRDATKLSYVKLPDGMNEIGSAAFQGCTSLETIEFPESVTTLGYGAFKESGLVSIDLSNITTFDEFYGMASHFADCMSLKSVTLNASVSVLPDSMFSGCKSLTAISLPSSLTYIKDKCFNNSGLRSIHIPASVTNIGNNAFLADSLQKITVDPLNTTYTVVNGILAEKGGKLLVCPANAEFENGELIIPEDYELSEGLFYGNRNIRKVVLPSTVTVIPKSLFADAESLEEVVIPEGVERIQANAFANCKSLVSVKIPSTLVSIGDDDSYNKGYVFSGCESLESIDLTDARRSLQFIGNDLFWATNLSSIDLSDFEMTELHEGMFRECANLSEVKLPQNLVFLGNETFLDCTSIETIDIPASVKYFAESSTNGEYISNTGRIFAGCEKLKTVNFLGNEVLVIGRGSFMNCTSLENITLPSSVKYINGGTVVAYIDGNYGSIPCGAFSGTAIKEITIPDGVTEIADYTFENCKKLVTVNYGQSVSGIGDYAFEGCVSLKDFTVGENIESIGACAFTESGIARVVIDAVNLGIGDSAFESCKSLSEVRFSDGIRSVGKAVFKNCTKLKSITLPSNVKYISVEMFAGSAIESITVPDYVNVIGENAFADCTSLKTVVLGNGVNEICLGAFANCTSVTKIIIPAQVYSLNSVFVADEDKALTDGYYDDEEEVLPVRATFEGWTENQTIEFELGKYQIAQLFDSEWSDDCSAAIIYK